MEDESVKNTNLELEEKAYDLLSRVGKDEDITVRDDQYDFPSLLDAVKLCRRRGFRFRLIDSGKLDRFQLEWLTEAGADLYTSDEARTNFLELDLVGKACKKSGAIFAYFHHGLLGSKEESGPVAFSELQNMGRNGVYLHLTNRERERDISRLNELAYSCRKGGSWLVYYHHGVFKSSLEELGRNSVWIHISDQSLREPEDLALVLDRVKSALSAGLKLVLHLEKGLDFSLLRDLISAKVYVLFKSSLFDYKSPFRVLEKKSIQRKLDFRAYYLYTTFLP